MDVETKEQFAAADARMTRFEQDLARYAQESDARMSRTEKGLGNVTEALSTFAAGVTRAAESSNARLTRVEENLEALIRAITREHGNGHSSQ